MEPMQKRILISVIIGIVLIVAFYAITNVITKYTGFLVVENENSFEKCLLDTKIILYINSRDVSATLEKTMLFDYLQYVSIHNCLENNKVCLDNEITSFPTWIINNNKIQRDINLEELKQATGCE